MPHCELHFSTDLDFDAEAILARVETIIKAHDANAQACKGRAYPAPIYRHTHLKVTVYLITQPYRDEAFTNALMNDLETQIKTMLPQSCYFSLLINYSPDYYVTNEHVAPGDG